MFFFLFFFIIRSAVRLKKKRPYICTDAYAAILYMGYFHSSVNLFVFPNTTFPLIRIAKLIE